LGIVAQQIRDKKKSQIKSGGGMKNSKSGTTVGSSRNSLRRCRTTAKSSDNIKSTISKSKTDFVVRRTGTINMDPPTIQRGGDTGRFAGSFMNSKSSDNIVGRTTSNISIRARSSSHSASFLQPKNIHPESISETESVTESQ
jgi:hypothetical protein